MVRSFVVALGLAFGSLAIVAQPAAAAPIAPPNQTLAGEAIVEGAVPLLPPLEPRVPRPLGLWLALSSLHEAARLLNLRTCRKKGEIIWNAKEAIQAFAFLVLQSRC